MSNSGTSNELAELRTIAALAGRIHLSTLPAEIADPLRAALVLGRLAFPRVFERLDRAGVALTLEELARTWRPC